MPKMLRIALCVLGFHAASAQAFQPLTEWREVERIRETAMAATARPGPLGKFDSHGGPLYLAPDGRFVMVPTFEEVEARGAMLGTHTLDGNILVLRFTGSATNRDLLTAQEAAAYDVMAAALAVAQQEDAMDAERAQQRLESALQHAAGVVGEEELAQLHMALEHIDELDVDVAHEQRLLAVPHAEATLLVDADSLAMLASRWRGAELTLDAQMWKLPATAAGHQTDGEAFDGSVVIARPLQAGLPPEITDLLIPGIVQARVVEVLTRPEDLAWKSHRGEVRVRIDRGADVGLFVGQMLNGMPPDERLGARVIEVLDASAVASIEVERFAPGDVPQMPAPGIVLANRVEHPLGCPLPVGVAVAATVTMAPEGADQLDWDEEGFAFFELTIDRGSHDGLALGDVFRFDPEDGWCNCEGQVRAVAAKSATVLFRLHRYGADHEVPTPGAGDMLVTPAWRSAYGAFNAPDAAETEVEVVP